MTQTPRSIRTPDQLLRVFVSSTLTELAQERRAVRAAIEHMRLAPVMFELGARPHPPRDLYRAYLHRSEIFVGIYWRQYGWVAPDETVSGLEDEYNLVPATMPRLIYIKTTSDEVEPRLMVLLQRIELDDRASYKWFDSADQLQDLVEADLATLLAERFDAANDAGLGAPEGPTVESRAEVHVQPIPVALTGLLGRSKELERVKTMFTRDGVRLVTLTGSGGIGKSRLATELGWSMKADFPDGVVFVALAALQEAAQVPAAIAGALGVRDTGVEPIVDTLITALRGRKVLIVADNFEHVLDATPTLTTLLTALPELSLLVTSRTVLRVLGEHRIEVGPLALPQAGSLARATALTSPAVQLFVQRARSVAPDFEVTDDNAAAVVGICVVLEGVPLALELAAASIRLLPPAAMLTRLQQHRPLAQGPANLPQRQRTLQNTIEWSVQLLDEPEKTLLHTLGVFSGGFSLSAAEAVAGDGHDVLVGLGVLVDSSLVRQQDRGDHAEFSLLSSVRQFAQQRLRDTGLLEQTRAAHATYYTNLAQTVAPLLRGRQQNETVLSLSEERTNLRSAVHYLLENREWDRLARFVWDIYVYWWVGGHLNEVRGWMDAMLTSGDAITDSTRAIALYYTRAITFWQQPDEWVVPGLTESAQLFHSVADPSGEALARSSVALAQLTVSPPDVDAAGDELEQALTLCRSVADTWGETLVLVTLGRVAFVEQKFHSALNRFEESLDLSLQHEDGLSAAIAMNHLGWAHLALGDVDTARVRFRESLSVSAITQHSEGMAYGLEGLVAVEAAGGDVERAGLLLGASEVLRERSGLYNVPTFTFHQQAIAPIIAGERADDLAAARARGRCLSAAEAVSLAMGSTEPANIRNDEGLQITPPVAAEKTNR